MKPSRHVIVSVSLAGILWFFTRSFSAALLCAASGVLCDTDHVIEYVVHFGWKGLTYDHLHHVCENSEKRIPGIKRFKKLYLLFHSLEIVILLWLAAFITKNIYVLAVATGYSSHIFLDMVGNKFYPNAYFLIFRAMKGFTTDSLFREEKEK